MTTGPLFSISPASASAPTPVTLVMPATGYKAAAIITDPCGKERPGAYLTITGHVATPHNLPHGTSYVDWIVTPDSPASSGGRVSMVLASKQSVGHASTCPAGHSPYGAHADPPPVHTNSAHGPVALTAATPSAWVQATGIGGYVLLAVALATAGLYLWRRRHHPKGSHR